jgi:hypothetical protein
MARAFYITIFPDPQMCKHNGLQSHKKIHKRGRKRDKGLQERAHVVGRCNQQVGGRAQEACRSGQPRHLVELVSQPSPLLAPRRAHLLAVAPTDLPRAVHILFYSCRGARCWGLGAAGVPCAAASSFVRHPDGSEMAGIGGEERSGDGRLGRRGDGGLGCGLGYFRSRFSPLHTRIRKGRGRKGAVSVRLFAGPALPWSQKSLTHPRTQLVPNFLTESNGCCRKRVQKITGAGATDDVDRCAPGSAVAGRVGSRLL